VPGQKTRYYKQNAPGYQHLIFISFSWVDRFAWKDYLVAMSKYILGALLGAAAGFGLYLASRVTGGG
jgi:hypothetical protein